eukprot:Sspe_Gene.107582::Locus_85806_Transcript_1_1_Confidence_1.000_Length_1813::g.107582::m.107582
MAVDTSPAVLSRHGHVFEARPWPAQPAGARFANGGARSPAASRLSVVGQGVDSRSGELWGGGSGRSSFDTAKSATSSPWPTGRSAVSTGREREEVGHHGVTPWQEGRMRQDIAPSADGPPRESAMRSLEAKETRHPSQLKERAFSRLSAKKEDLEKEVEALRVKLGEAGRSSKMLEQMKAEMEQERDMYDKEVQELRRENIELNKKLKAVQETRHTHDKDAKTVVEPRETMPLEHTHPTVTLEQIKGELTAIIHLFEPRSEAKQRLTKLLHKVVAALTAKGARRRAPSFAESEMETVQSMRSVHYLDHLQFDGDQKGAVNLEGEVAALAAKLQQSELDKQDLEGRLRLAESQQRAAPAVDVERVKRAMEMKLQGEFERSRKATEAKLENAEKALADVRATNAILHTKLASSRREVAALKDQLSGMKKEPSQLTVPLHDTRGRSPPPEHLREKAEALVRLSRAEMQARRVIIADEREARTHLNFDDFSDASDGDNGPSTPNPLELFLPFSSRAAVPTAGIPHQSGQSRAKGGTATAFSRRSSDASRGPLSSSRLATEKPASQYLRNSSMRSHSHENPTRSSSAP